MSDEDIYCFLENFINLLERQAFRDRMAHRRRCQQGRQLPGDGEARALARVRHLETLAEKYRETHADLRPPRG